MFFLWNAVLVFTPDVTGHTPSKKFNFCLTSPQNICPKDFLSAVAFALELSHAVFSQSLSWIMNIDLHLWITALTVVHWSPKALEIAL